MKPEKWLNDREQLYVADQNVCAHCGRGLRFDFSGTDQPQFCSASHKASYDQKHATPPQHSNWQPLGA